MLLQWSKGLGKEFHELRNIRRTILRSAQASSIVLVESVAPVWELGPLTSNPHLSARAATSRIADLEGAVVVVPQGAILDRLPRFNPKSVHLVRATAPAMATEVRNVTHAQAREELPKFGISDPKHKTLLLYLGPFTPASDVGK